MKNNRDKLNDALGMVDEDAVQSALTYAERVAAARTAKAMHKATLRRRLTVAAAACLSLTMIAGAMLALPFLKADEPAESQPPVTVTTEEAVPFYVEAPMVRIGRLSAGETADLSSPDITTEPTSTQVSNLEDYFQYYTWLTIDCEPGETVTLTADTDCLLVIDRTYESLLSINSMIDYELELWRYNHRRDKQIGRASCRERVWRKV